MTITELSRILGNFGEFVGAIAVVAILVHLAIQGRHSKEAMEANRTRAQPPEAPARGDPDAKSQAG